MLMGKVVSRNKYELYEYVTAGLISLGMILFMFGSHDDNAGLVDSKHSVDLSFYIFMSVFLTLSHGGGSFLLY